MTEDPAGVYVHVIDSDSRRRAQLSRELMSRNVHAEIYEDIGEFLHSLPPEGSILVVDETGDDLAAVFDQIKERSRFFPLSVYSEAARPERIVDALRAGAVDYLQWPIEPRLLDRALERLVEEQDRRLKLEQTRATARDLVGDLTSRENEVLVSLVSGNSNKEIAQELGISHRTVEIYRKNMMAKLKARSTADAVRIAIYAGVWTEGNVSPFEEPLSNPTRNASQAAKIAEATSSPAASPWPDEPSSHTRAAIS